MKKALIILLSFILQLPALIKLDIVIDFKLHQDFIAKVLCINKDVPETTCKGKCYLSQQIKEIEDHQSQNAPNNKTEKLEISFYIVENYRFKFSNPLDYSKLSNNFFFEQIHTSGVISNIFHPPRNKYHFIG